jgi:hypothetical protein
MKPIVPGVYHWTGSNQHGSTVSSYWLETARAVVDPTIPEGGLEELAIAPERIVLTSGHHLRDAPAFAEHFGIPIRGLAQVAAHVGDAAAVEVVQAGQEVAPGVVGLHVGVISDDECALYIAADHGALALADAVNHTGDELSFFPDRLLGDDPEAVKAGLRTRLAELATDYPFVALLFAHGEPIDAGGAARLERFVST